MADAPFEFYFDFNSPYGYVGAHLIDNIAERYDRATDWYPVLLGVAFKQTGARPMTEVPIKGAYQVRDAARTCRYYGVPFKQPDVHPFSSTAASRAVYWVKDQDPAKANQFALALFEAALAKNQDISAPASVARVGATVGLDQKAIIDALGEPAVKQRLIDETNRAVEKGVFGAPFVIVDGEPFWGVDRFEMIDEWLVTGGF